MSASSSSSAAASASAAANKKRRYPPPNEIRKRRRVTAADSAVTQCGRGFLVTCLKGREKMATRDAFYVLNLILDEHMGDTTVATAGTKAAAEPRLASAPEGDSLAAEIAALKSQTAEPSQRRLNRLQIPCVGVCIITLSKEVSHGPTAVTNKLFELAVEGHPRMSRFINYMYPLQQLCRATEKNLISGTRDLLSEHFGSPRGNASEYSKTFGIRYKGRYMPKEFRQTAIKVLSEGAVAARSQLQDSIGQAADVPSLSVNLEQPDVWIVAQGVWPLIGVSVVRGSDYQRSFQYNLDRCFHKYGKMEGDNSAPGVAAAEDTAAPAGDAGATTSPTKD